jgi:hypothetical protein
MMAPKNKKTKGYAMSLCSGNVASKAAITRDEAITSGRISPSI